MLILEKYYQKKEVGQVVFFNTELEYHDEEGKEIIAGFNGKINLRVYVKLSQLFFGESMFEQEKMLGKQEQTRLKCFNLFPLRNYVWKFFTGGDLNFYLLRLSNK